MRNSITATTVCIFLILTIVQYANSQTVICSRSSSSYNIEGSLNVNTRDKILNTANFGPSASFCPVAFSTATLTSLTITELNNNNCSIYWSGFESNSLYSAADYAVMDQFTANGGKIVAGCDSTSNSPLCTYIGLTLSSNNVASGTSSIAPAVQSCFPGIPTNSTIENGGGAVTIFDNVGNFTVVTIQDQLNGTSCVYNGDVLACTDVNQISGGGSSCCVSAGDQLNNGNDYFIGELLCNLAQGSSSSACLDLPLTIDEPVEGDDIVDVSECPTVLVTGFNAESPTSAITVTFTDSANTTITAAGIIQSNGTWAIAETDVCSLANGVIVIDVVETSTLSGDTNTDTHNITLNVIFPSVSPTASPSATSSLVVSNSVTPSPLATPSSTVSPSSSVTALPTVSTTTTMTATASVTPSPSATTIIACTSDNDCGPPPGTPNYGCVDYVCDLVNSICVMNLNDVYCNSFSVFGSSIECVHKVCNPALVGLGPGDDSGCVVDETRTGNCNTGIPCSEDGQCEGEECKPISLPAVANDFCRNDNPCVVSICDVEGAGGINTDSRGCLDIFSSGRCTPDPNNLCYDPENGFCDAITRQCSSEIRQCTCPSTSQVPLCQATTGICRCKEIDNDDDDEGIVFNTQVDSIVFENEDLNNGFYFDDSDLDDYDIQINTDARPYLNSDLYTTSVDIFSQYGLSTDDSLSDIASDLGLSSSSGDDDDSGNGKIWIWLGPLIGGVLFVAVVIVIAIIAINRRPKKSYSRVADIQDDL